MVADRRVSRKLSEKLPETNNTNNDHEWEKSTMLEFQYIPGDAQTQKIIKSFINNRLISLMEGIILDEVDWNMAMDGTLKDVPKDASFSDLVDIDSLAADMDFAENVSLSYLPENYPIEKANREFFGLYKLLKAKKEYVPELPMEYVLYHVIMNEVWQVDQINEDTEDGLFDAIIEDVKDDPFFAGIEDEEYTTIERIPEPERSMALKGIRDDAEQVAYESTEKGDGSYGEVTEEDIDTVAEELLSRYEDLREYKEICFWDTDFMFLDDYDEDDLIHSPVGEFMGLAERKDIRSVDMDLGGSKVHMELNVAPWENEE